MDEYRVTYSNGKNLVIEAWTPELATAVAEEEADQYGCEGQTVVSVELLATATLEPS